MSDHTEIAWTDATWNPVRGCSKVSAGCTHCYAEAVAHRFSGPGRPYEGLASGGHWTGEVRLLPELLELPLRWRKPRRVFVNSMSDLFHEKVPDSFIDQVFAVMAIASHHVFQVLTKRPARMRRYFEAGDELCFERWPAAMRLVRGESSPTRLPLQNVWLGTTVEDQAAADERIPELLSTPAAVRWLSVEPMIEAVNLRSICVRDPEPNEPDENGVVGGYYLDPLTGHAWDDENGELREASEKSGLDWFVVGGESGPRARPCDVAWIRDVMRQCRDASVPVFVKQLGSDSNAHQLLPAGFEHCIRHKKGGDPAEWPEDLRVREYPEVRHA